MMHKLKSLDELMNEDFYNPFDEDDKKETKPTHIAENGGILALRKESFNINRIEYTKRPDGSYTIISKTQFAKGEVVEICPIMILGIECKSINKLKDIIFELDKNKEEYAVVFGYGSLYRHAQDANVEYAYNRGAKQLYFIAKRFIKVGEELNINYGRDYWQERSDFNLISKQNPVDLNHPALKSVEESGGDVQPSMSDTLNTSSTGRNSNPQSMQNPVHSGVPILGSGQS